MITRVEYQTLRLLAEGLENTEIAARRGVAMVTVRNTLTRLHNKLDTRNRVHLVVTALRLGHITLEELPG